MTRHFAIFLTATAIAACSSDPQAMTEPANVASLTPGALAGAPSQAEFLASEPATPDAYVPARQAEPSLPVPPPLVVIGARGL